jgi:carbon-monoxide dehydrogenase large subunit
VPLEPGGIVADYDAGRDTLKLYATTQSLGLHRAVIAGQLGIPPHKVSIVQGDVGGSFGQKFQVRREEIAVAHASRVLRRPVKWMEDRAENLLVGGQARGEVVEAAVAAQADGTILAFDLSTIVDQGAYPTIPLPGTIEPTITGVLFPSALRFESYRYSFKLAVTNKSSRVPYRGPWAVETWVREALLDELARELGLAPEEVRRRNMITLDEQPRPLISGPMLEGVTARETLDRALELVDLDAFRAEQAAAREDGRYLGLGFATFVEAAPGPPDWSKYFAGIDVPAEEGGKARLDMDGTVLVYSGQLPHGQGHETTLAQVAADELGIPFSAVRVVEGDTGVVPFSLGTGGSRSATMASGSVVAAVRALKARILACAAVVLKIDAGELELCEGTIRSRDGETELTLAALGQATSFSAPPGFAGGIEAQASYKAPRGGWVQGTHLCTVEVDVETGLVSITRYLVVEDCGSLINPAIVDGQIRGGVAQGIGMVLLENPVTEDAQPLATSFMDYLLPTTLDIPTIEIDHLESPPLDEINYRGVGEGGLVGSPAAVANAISDALTPFGRSITRLPVTPERVVEIVDAGH